MLQLPDGNILDMRWKSVSYITKEKRFLFPIEPMIIGEVEIIRNGYLTGSLMDKVIIPILRENDKVKIFFK